MASRFITRMKASSTLIVIGTVAAVALLILFWPREAPLTSPHAPEPTLKERVKTLEEADDTQAKAIVELWLDYERRQAEAGEVGASN